MKNLMHVGSKWFKKNIYNDNLGWLEKGSSLPKQMPSCV